MYRDVFCLAVLLFQDIECFTIFIDPPDKAAFGAPRKDSTVLIHQAVVCFFAFILQCYCQTALHKEVEMSVDRVERDLFGIDLFCAFEYLRYIKAWLSLQKHTKYHLSFLRMIHFISLDTSL